MSFSRIDAGLGIYHLFVWSNSNFLHKSQWITFPTQSCLVLFSFCANLLYSPIMWLIVSLPHNLNLLFCCFLSILALIWLGLMTLFCAVIWRDSVSLLRFPFLSYLHVFSCEMSLVYHLKHPWNCFPPLLFQVVVLRIPVSLVLFQLAVISLPLRFSM